MVSPELLLRRLDEIGRKLSQTPNALALIGLGSVGQELDRIDQYSDLDFFVIVKISSKVSFLNDLGWLTSIAPTAYYFANTEDGYKLLYEDGVFCEFAVFEEPELAGIPFSKGRFIWRANSVDDSLANAPEQQPVRPVDWLLGEALTNLYIGLLRDLRGEKIAAMRLIQVFAVDRVLELIEQSQAATAAPRDQFGVERRFEVRFPQIASQLPTFMQGYNRNLDSAAAILSYLTSHFATNAALVQRIENLVASKHE